MADQQDPINAETAFSEEELQRVEGVRAIVRKDIEGGSHHFALNPNFNLDEVPVDDLLMFDKIRVGEVATVEDVHAFATKVEREEAPKQELIERDCRTRGVPYSFAGTNSRGTFLGYLMNKAGVFLAMNQMKEKKK